MPLEGQDLIRQEKRRGFPLLAAQEQGDRGNALSSGPVVHPLTRSKGEGQRVIRSLRAKDRNCRIAEMIWRVERWNLFQGAVGYPKPSDFHDHRPVPLLRVVTRNQHAYAIGRDQNLQDVLGYNNRHQVLPQYLFQWMQSTSNFVHP